MHVHVRAIFNIFNDLGRLGLGTGEIAVGLPDSLPLAKGPTQAPLFLLCPHARSCAIPRGPATVGVWCTRLTGMESLCPEASSFSAFSSAKEPPPKRVL